MRLSYYASNPAKKRHVFLLSAVALGVGGVTAFLPAEETAARLIFAGMGLLLFLLLEGFALRFTLVSFRYEILENRLLIVRVFRRREKPVLSLPLKEINAMYPVSSCPVGRMKNACPTLRGRRETGTVILYGDAKREKAVVVDCPLSFARALSGEAARLQLDPEQKQKAL
ncbi:MAG: hypothetical protein J5849_02955 [Clostridia bacterium]|nr:hypothetical protein [Clostridia bacterium]